MRTEGVTRLIWWYMKERRLSQSQLADKVGMTQATFSRRMADPKTFKVGELEKIFRVLGVPENERVIEL